MVRLVHKYTEKVPLVRLWPGLHDIMLIFMPDRFPESGIKNDPEYKSEKCVVKSP